MAEGSSRTSEFEASLAELERIVERLDRDELSLDEALTLFEAGVGHLRAASRLLDEARGVVEELIEDAAGQLSTVEFDVPVGGAADEETGD